MAEQKLRFQLTAYDPTPSDVTLAFNESSCHVEKTSGANITVEDYKSTPEGGPSEIHLKVTPEPIAFVMRFVDGKMTIEFKGSWAAFQLEAAAAKKEVVVEAPAPVVVDDTPAFSEICFKVHLNEDQAHAHDIRLNWDMKELSAPNGGDLYSIVYQKDTEAGKEFVVAVTDPESGQIYYIRAILKNDRVTFFNTNKFDMENIQFYLSFYIQDPELRAKILAELEANPGYEISILIKYKCYAEDVDFSSLVPYIKHLDKDKKPIKSKDTDDCDHVKRAREAKEAAEKKGKTGAEAPDSEWSCGKVKWELPKEDKKFRDVGKLKIPDLKGSEHQSQLKDVGKLKWGGFDQEEPKEIPKEKPKVGKLNIGAFGAPAAEEAAAPPPKRSWKKRGSTTPAE